MSCNCLGEERNGIRKAGGGPSGRNEFQNLIFEEMRERCSAGVNEVRSGGEMCKGS